MMRSPLFSYLVTLSVIQPARIQDVEQAAGDLLGSDAESYANSGRLRQAHEDARRANLVVPVRKGLYSLSLAGAERVRVEPLVWQLDNARMFLIKQKRRKIF